MWDAIEVEQRDFADPLAEHADAGVDELLPLLGRLVLGVLTKIAELARTLDLLRKLGLELALQLADLILEAFE